MCSRCRYGFSGQESRRAKEGPAKGSRAETVLVSKKPSMLKLFSTRPGLGCRKLLVSFFYFFLGILLILTFYKFTLKLSRH